MFCKWCGATTQQLPYVVPEKIEEDSPASPLRSIPCKVCEHGVLVSKKIFRMSRPVVAIGYILLVPSLLGMLLSALALLGVLSYSGAEQNSIIQSSPSPQQSFDDSFRISCMTSGESSIRKHQLLFPPTAGQLEKLRQSCECALSEIKATGSTQGAIQVCGQRLKLGSLTPLDLETENIYSNLESTAKAQPTGNALIGLFHIISGGFALLSLVAFFVSGLLGWLLVMKKQVLRCNVCGAVISAS